MVDSVDTVLNMSVVRRRDQNQSLAYHFNILLHISHKLVADG